MDHSILHHPLPTLLLLHHLVFIVAEILKHQPLGRAAPEEDGLQIAKHRRGAGTRLVHVQRADGVLGPAGEKSRIQKLGDGRYAGLRRRAREVRRCGGREDFAQQ